MSHGDEVYDIIEEQDKKTIRNELLAPLPSAGIKIGQANKTNTTQKGLNTGNKQQQLSINHNNNNNDMNQGYVDYDDIDDIKHQSQTLSNSTSRIALCRMNVSRNARRQMRFGDQKVVLIEGHYFGYLPLSSRDEPVFVATCTPIAMPETRECVVQGSTNVFTTIHSMDLKFLYMDHM